MKNYFKNFEYNFFNYFIITIIIYFSYNNNFSSEDFLQTILFLYLKDIIFTNPYINNLFIENYMTLKSKKNFFKLIFETSYSILIFYIIILSFINSILTINLHWLILIPFSIINTILLILAGAKHQKSSLIISCIIFLIYVLLFQNYKIEIFLLLVCITELILITFFSNYRLIKFDFLKNINDMRTTFFFKKITVNLIFSQLFKIIFIFFVTSVYFFYNIKNLELIFYLLLILEVGDIFENFIKKSFWHNLTSNFQVQKNNHKNYQKIFKVSVIYFLIGTSLIYLSNKHFFNDNFYNLIFFIILFFSYNLEKIKNLILLSMDRNISYKKYFIYNIANIMIIFFIINSFYPIEQLILLSKVLVIYFVFFELINIKVITKYI